MSPIIRSEVQSIEISMPHFPLSGTKLSVAPDKTQEIILELLMNSMEISLVQEKVFQNRKVCKQLRKEVWEGVQGKKVKTSVQRLKEKGRKYAKQFIRKPINYIEPKEYFTRKQWLK